MFDLGIVRPGSTIRIPFPTFDKDDGSSITMTNYAAGDILIYKDGVVTERASTSGYTATTDFDAKTGRHIAVITLSDNTTAGFFNAGSEYLVMLDSVTVDTVTVGTWLARFTIGYPGAILDTTIASLASQTSFTLIAGPAEDDALNGMYAIIHDIASAVQLSRVLILDYTGSTRTVTLAAGATFTVTTGDNFSVMHMAPLQPATIGRSLGLESDGHAHADLKEWLGVAPLALSSQRVQVHLGGGDIGVITNTLIAADAIGASELATDAVQEIRNAITGGAYPLNTDSNGSIRVVDGTGTGEINTASGNVPVYDLTPAALTELSDSVWDEILTAATHNTNNSAGKILRTLTFSSNAMHEGIAVTGTVNTITLDAGASSVDGTYDPGLVAILIGTGAGQSRMILNYVGSTRVATVDRDWRTIPDSTSEFAILGVPSGAHVHEGVPTAVAVGTVTLGSGSSTVDDMYNGQVIFIKSGTGQDQARIISDYNGTTKVATITPNWVVTPTTTSGYIVVPVLTDPIVVREALGMANADLDDQLDALPDDILDQADGIETGVTPRQALRAIAAKAAGLISGAGSGTEVIKGIGQSSGGTTRLTATVDSSGNITVWALNL